MNRKYMPEGSLIASYENKCSVSSISSLREAMMTKKILEARVEICDNEHNLIVNLCGIKGIIPREEGAIGITEGQTRDIALISRVNKPVCFYVTDISDDNKTIFLSRKAVQEDCRKEFIENLIPGDIIPAKVTHIDSFGCFVDIGCGIPSLIPIDSISVSRISHPSDRFDINQDIYVVVKGNDGDKILLSHKELLGTWKENSDNFESGQTVAGIVRSIENYGIFIELAPNLAGLAEFRGDVKVGQSASVYIKAIIPDKMKIKLVIVDVFDSDKSYKEPVEYFLTADDEHIDFWKYSTEESNKDISVVF